MPTGAEERLVRGVSCALSSLPPGLGQSALARRYVGLARWHAGAVRRRRFTTGAVLDLDLGDRIQAQAWFLRGYSLEILEYIARSTPRSGVVLDVGGNVGLITFPLLARRPDLNVHAFEPNPSNIAAWLQNRRLNPSGSATLAEVAVGAEPGRANLVVPSDSGSGYIEPGEGDLPIVTLDAYTREHGIDRVDLLKLDIEGHEFEALQGAKRLLDERRIDRIVCEFNDVHLARIGMTERDVEVWLADRGFQRRSLPTIGARGLRGSVSADAAFALR